MRLVAVLVDGSRRCGMLRAATARNAFSGVTVGGRVVGHCGVSGASVCCGALLRRWLRVRNWYLYSMVGGCVALLLRFVGNHP